MILRHARESADGQPLENTFEAIDERSGAKLGECTIYVSRNEQLFPARPSRVYMDIHGDPAPDALLGASIARAKEIAMASGTPARIFTQVDPKDVERLEALKPFGFRDNDGLIRLELPLPAKEPEALPITCVEVIDLLDDPIEQKYFLERYSQLFNEEYDFEWLHSFRDHAGFRRILIVAPTGMAGEAVIWQEGNSGVIAWLHTSKKWRRMGVAQRLIELACREFERAGMDYAEMEVQARVPNILRIMERAGFRQTKLIMRYPGIDIG